MKRSLFILVATFVLTIWLSCSGNPSDNDASKTGPGNNVQSQNTLKLKAQLGAGYSLKSSGRFRAPGSQDVDQVWAVPINFDDYLSSLLTNRLIVAIGSNGAFELTITNNKNEDWMLLLVNSQADQSNKIVSYVTINDINNTLLKMPLTHATNDINLGSLTTNSNNEAVSSVNLPDLNAFSLSIDKLREIARTDKLLKLTRNFYRNYNTNNGTFRLITPSYTFGPASFTNITNAGVSNFKYRSYWLCYIVNDSLEIPADCTNNGSGTVVSLKAPVPVDAWLSSDGTTTNLSELNSTLAASHMFYYNSVLSMWGIPCWSFYTTDIGGDIPPGLWNVEKNSSQLAAFDFGFGSILYNATVTRPKVYVPKLKLNVNASNLITAMEVSWYLLDESGVEKEADMELFWGSLNKDARPYISVRNMYDQDLVKANSGVVTLSDNNGNNINILNFTNRLVFNTNYTTNAISDPSNTVNMIHIFYNSYGAQFNFQWKQCEFMY